MDFDINSVSAMYNQYLSDAVTGAKSPTAKINLGADYSKASDDELMGVCKDFEAYFLEQCFKEMMKTTGAEEKTGSMRTLVDYYKDSLVQEIASKSTETGSLGLAQMLYEQMKRNYDL